VIPWTAKTRTIVIRRASRKEDDRSGTVGFRRGMGPEEGV
jgi:hypothetical protein